MIKELLKMYWISLYGMIKFIWALTIKGKVK